MSVYTRTVARTRGRPGMAAAMRVTIGLMMNASSQARKKASRMSLKNASAWRPGLTAMKNRTTVAQDEDRVDESTLPTRWAGGPAWPV